MESDLPPRTPEIDVGLTHVALAVSDLDRSISFYARFADMKVVHRRSGAEPHSGVAWISDRTRPFVVVLLERTVTHVLGTPGHLGVGCASRDEVDLRLDDARSAGFVVSGPYDSGPPVGYWATISDPDGHLLELAFGQIVGLTVAGAHHGSTTISPG